MVFGKHFRVSLVALALATSQARAQAPSPNPARFFAQEPPMTVGVYYYPEQWPRAQWDRDLKNMARAGFHFTHFGEFAWTFVEPEEGKFDFTWLDEAVALAHQQGLKVIMCTSTPTPPAWLAEKHPEILMVNAEGRTMQHGARQHISWSSPVYRQYVQRMVEALGQHYGHDTRIWGWQLDNEPSHYGRYDYSPAARVSFQRWLLAKYQTVVALNAAWGTAFWSIRYDNFEQVRIPNQQELIAQPMPAALLDFKRFSADEANDFLSFQYKLLRQRVAPGQWITTNLMPEHVDVDPTRITGLDFLTYTRYPVAGDAGLGPQGFRLGNPTTLGFSNDLLRPLTGTFGIMELQPGQVNWGWFNPQPLPGAVRMWLWHAFAGGNRFVCTYRYRQPLTGGEQYHQGIMGTDGVTPTLGGGEYIQMMGELKAVQQRYRSGAKMPDAYRRRQAALLYNADNRWELDNQPQTTQWNTLGHMKRYYSALKQLGAPVDIITEDKDFTRYPVLVAPAYELLDARLVARWQQYVQQGGHLVLTTRTGQKDRTGKLWEGPWAAPITDLIGAKVALYDLLPPAASGSIAAEGQAYAWNNWADVLEPLPGTEVWATYTNQFYRGKAAVVSRRLGKGTVTYVGPDTDDGALEKAVLQKLYQRAGIAVADYPEGVLLDWRDGFWVGVNYAEQPYTLPVPATAKVLVGRAEVPQGGVVVWQE